MLLIDALRQPGRSFIGGHPAPAQPGRSIRPRLDLQTGSQVGQSIAWPAESPDTNRLVTACTLALASGGLVSIPAPGDPQALLAPVRQALLSTGLPPGRLELIFSADALEEPGVETLLALSALRDEGIGLALEGFGRGRLALAHRLPLSCLILAPACIAQIPGSPAALALLHTLVDLAHAQQLTVVATGITTENQRAVLSGLGCDCGEGTLFGPALPQPLSNPPCATVPCATVLCE